MLHIRADDLRMSELGKRFHGLVWQTNFSTGFEPENVAEECTVRLGVFGVDDYMSG